MFGSPKKLLFVIVKNKILQEDIRNYQILKVFLKIK